MAEDKKVPSDSLDPKKQALIGLLVKSMQHLLEEATECPIANAPMEKPVINAAGHTYEKEEIDKWFKKNNTDPSTGTVLTSKELIDNHLVNKYVHLSQDICALTKYAETVINENTTIVKTLLHAPIVEDTNPVLTPSPITNKSRPSSLSISKNRNSFKLSEPKNPFNAQLLIITNATFNQKSIVVSTYGRTLRLGYLVKNKISKTTPIVTDYNEISFCSAIKIDDHDYIIGLGIKNDSNKKYYLFVYNLKKELKYNEETKMDKGNIVCLKNISDKELILGTEHETNLVSFTKEKNGFKITIRSIFSLKDDSIIDIAILNEAKFLLLSKSEGKYQIGLLDKNGSYRIRCELDKNNGLTYHMITLPLANDLKQVLISSENGNHLYLDTDFPNHQLPFKVGNLSPDHKLDQIISLTDGLIACHYKGNKPKTVVFELGLNGEHKEIANYTYESDMKLFFHKNAKDLIAINPNDEVIRYSLGDLRPCDAFKLK